MKVEIEVKELAKLIRNDAMLSALDCAGVDNWIGYGDAFNDEFSDGGPDDYNRYQKMSDEEVVKDYFKL